MDDHESLFAQRLRALIAGSGQSQVDVERATGISQQTISRWSAAGVPNATELVALANHFGVTVDYLLGRCDERTWLIDQEPLDALTKARTKKDIAKYLNKHGDMPFAVRMPMPGKMRLVDDREKEMIERESQPKLDALLRPKMVRRWGGLRRGNRGTEGGGRPEG